MSVGKLKSQQLKFFPFALAFYVIFIFLSNDMYLPAMPTIGRELQLSQEQVQLTLLFWFLGSSSLQLLVGPFADYYGHKRIVVSGCVVFLLSSIACALVTGLNHFLIARLMQGTAVCSALVAGYAAIHELYPSKTAMKLLALMNSLTILAPAIGPLGGAMITEFYSWRYIFWFLAFGALLSIVMLARYMPVTQLKREPVKVLIVARSYITIASNRSFMFLNLAHACLIAVFFTWMFESPFIMIEIYAKSGLFYGIVQTLIFSCYFIGFALTKWLLDNSTLRVLILSSCGFLITGAIILIVDALVFKTLFLTIAGMMLLAVGSSMLAGPLNRLAMDSIPKQTMANKSAIYSTVISILAILSGSALSALRSETLLAMNGLVVLFLVSSILLIYFSKLHNMDTQLKHQPTA